MVIPSTSLMQQQTHAKRKLFYPFEDDLPESYSPTKSKLCLPVKEWLVGSFHFHQQSSKYCNKLQVA
jgi:hypothetical protein